jgi:hypothetical protein
VAGHRDIDRAHADLSELRADDRQRQSNQSRAFDAAQSGVSDREQNSPSRRYESCPQLDSKPNTRGAILA